MAFGFYVPPTARGTGRPLQFAQLKPPEPEVPTSFLDNIVGIARIVGVIAEVLLAIVAAKFAPGILPAIAIGGSLYHQTIDTIQFSNHPQPTGWTKSMFAVNTLINFAPVAFTFRKVIRKSKNVLRLTDQQGVVRYVTRGHSQATDRIFKSIDLGLFKGTKRVSQVSIALQNNLIARGVIPKVMKLQYLPKFEKHFHKVFSAGKGRTGYFQSRLGGFGKNVKYSADRAFIYSNRDRAILRNEVRKLAQGKTTIDAALDRIAPKISFQAQAALDIGKRTFRYNKLKLGKILTKESVKKVPRTRKIIWRDDYIKKKFAERLLDLAEIYKPEVPVQRPFFIRFLQWFGTKKGRAITQAGQLPNANDFARELLRQPQNALLEGGAFEIGGKVYHVFGKSFAKKGGLRGIARSLRKKVPIIQKLLEKPLLKRIYAHYEFVVKALKEKGVLLEHRDFLMGWRVMETQPKFRTSTVIFYFNPINTKAKTPGSFNYGGKPACLVPNVFDSHLKFLRKTLHPGKAYLKGAGGFAPIATTPGGRRNQISILNKAMEMLSLFFPLSGLRNFFSLASNTKQVIVKIANRTYLPTWKYTFKNTLERLWLNRVTRIFGQTVGNIVSNEMGMHTSRILKNVAQGFQRKRTEVAIIKGQKVRFQRTVLTTAYNPQTLYKTGVTETARSVGLRRIKRGSSTKERLKQRRQGTTLRRAGRLFGEW